MCGCGTKLNIGMPPQKSKTKHETRSSIKDWKHCFGGRQGRTAGLGGELGRMRCNGTTERRERRPGMRRWSWEKTSTRWSCPNLSRRWTTLSAESTARSVLFSVTGTRRLGVGKACVSGGPPPPPPLAHSVDDLCGAGGRGWLKLKNWRW